jgi:hypothetical protein
LLEGAEVGDEFGGEAFQSSDAGGEEGVAAGFGWGCIRLV